MTIRDFANLPENFDYFWIEKQSSYSFYPYLGYYRGCQSIAIFQSIDHLTTSFTFIDSAPSNLLIT